MPERPVCTGMLEQRDRGADTTAEVAAKEVIFTSFQGWRERRRWGRREKSKGLRTRCERNVLCLYRNENLMRYEQGKSSCKN